MATNTMSSPDMGQGHEIDKERTLMNLYFKITWHISQRQREIFKTKLDENGPLHQPSSL